jgi:hypothetical protein
VLDEVVATHRFPGFSREGNPPCLEDDRTLAEPLDVRHRVGHEEHGDPSIPQGLQPAVALLLEEDVAHGQRLVDQEHVGIHAHRHREGHPHEHPARVELHGLIEELADLGEGLDLGEPRLHLAPRDAEQRSIQDRVLAPRELRVEAAAQFEQGRDPARHDHLALGRTQRAREDLQERALPRAVPADDADRLAPSDPERDVAERPELVSVATAEASEEHLLQPVRWPCVDPVHLPQIRNFEHRRHRTSANPRFVFMNHA